MTLDEFRDAVYSKLHDAGYCKGMEDSRIIDGLKENEDIVQATYKGIKENGETWCVSNAAWNISMCI